MVFTRNRVQSNLAISNSVNSKSPLFQRKNEFPWIYPYVFSHLLSAISNSVISNSPLNQPRYFELVRAQLETYCILFELESRALSLQEIPAVLFIHDRQKY